MNANGSVHAVVERRAESVTFEPIARETVSAQIRTQLLARITNGELAPGSQLPSERALAESFQVARTSVREAIQGLISLQLIERRGNRSFVPERLPEIEVGTQDEHRTFVTELFETRMVLEVPIFRLAAERATDADRAAVALLIDQFEPTMSIDDFRRLDREFHNTIASACRNPLLIELYGKVLDRLFRSSTFDSLLSSEVKQCEVNAIVAESVSAHRRIAKALAAGDADAMVDSVRDHLTQVETRMVDELI